MGLITGIVKLHESPRFSRSFFAFDIVKVQNVAFLFIMWVVVVLVALLEILLIPWHVRLSIYVAGVPLDSLLHDSDGAKDILAFRLRS